ncbi:MAG: DUF3795 domain-containing protein [Lachnospiraceae bacterium]
MIMPAIIENKMLAPCGVNCLACSAYLNKKKPCPGCRALAEEHKRKSCRNCVKKKCAFDKELTWCFECMRFPCTRIKDLNKRYKQNYNVDIVQNGLDALQNMELFMEAQRERFTYRQCGGVIDQHHFKCSECGKEI